MSSRHVEEAPEQRKKHQERAGIASELEAKGIERASKVNFSLFPRNSRELFL